MQLLNKFIMKLEGFEKSLLHVDADCPLGHLYDYLCAAQAFVMQKIQEAEAAKKQQSSESQAPADEPAVPNQDIAPAQ